MPRRVLEEGGFYDRDPRDYGLRVAVIYPGPYEAAVNSLGHQIVYYLANSVPGVLAERFTLDSVGSVESGLNLREFNVIIASLHFEGQVHTLLSMLREAGIPLRREGRDTPVVVGGPVTANPLPLEGFADAVAVGDGEGTVQEILRILLEGGGVEDLGSVEGVYTPGGRARFRRSPLTYLPEGQIRARLPNGKQNPFLLELSRGCSHGCRFCLLGWTQRPRRDRPLGQLMSQVELAKELGFRKVYIIGSDVLGHPKALDILQRVIDEGLKLSLPSLRADMVTAEMAEVLRASGLRKVSLAPETGSPRLAAAINKRSVLEEILEASELLKAAGIRELKLYLMVGLPGEAKEDLSATAELARLVKSAGVRVELSVSQFVPKPHTPLQLAPMARPDAYRSGVRYLRARAGVRVKAVHPGRAALQGLVSLAPRGSSAAVLEAAEGPYRLSNYFRAFARWGLNPERILYGSRDAPWRDAVDTGVRDEALQAESERAEAGVTTPSCDEQCWGCGVCPLSPHP
ncbi:MAG: radical SAM protein [Candidatus Korarchaeota archaeon]|nr:radical SAM protein [Candidatus Korarchaeota archaeon]